ncbi:MAG: fasciclin domain-containing protein [Balneolaceae bacterium]
MRNFNKYIQSIGLLAIITIGFTACGDDNNGSTPDDSDFNIVERVENNESYSTLSQIIADLGLESELSDGQLTLFAPTNDAFDGLPEGLLDDLSDEQLTQIITYHASEGEYLSANLDSTQDLTMLQGERVLVQEDEGSVTVNGSVNVVDADLEATNGVVHGIDEVLLPAEFRDPSLIETAEEAGNFETLLAIVEDLGLTTTLQFLGPYTTFAPTDEAFDTLFETINPDELSNEQLRSVVTYHVLDGEYPSDALEAEQTVTSLGEEDLYITSNGGVTVNGSSTVVSADVTASNGIIHAVDQVLLPNEFIPVADIVAKNYNLTTLNDLLEQYNLVETLSGDGAYTVFAPTNQAFEDASELIATLSDDEIEEVLLYHAAAVEALSGDLEDGQTIETLQGEEITVTISDETVTLNNSVSVETADLDGTNGVVHIVDGVLVPPSFE